jgi:hypothetical protein
MARIVHDHHDDHVLEVRAILIFVPPPVLRHELLEIQQGRLRSDRPCW